MVITEVLGMWSPELALDQLDAFQQSCRRYRESFFLDDCLSYMRDVDPSWFSIFAATLTPARAFREGAGVVAVQLAYGLAMEGYEPARDLVEAGARGEFGGTDAQIRRAMGVGFGIQEKGRPVLDFLVSIAESTAIPNGTRAGSELAALLLMRDCWPDGDSRPALEVLLGILDNPRFSESAALQVLYVGNDPEPGSDPELWTRVVERARTIGGTLGTPR